MKNQGRHRPIATRRTKGSEPGGERRRPRSWMERCGGGPRVGISGPLEDVQRGVVQGRRHADSELEVVGHLAPTFGSVDDGSLLPRTLRAQGRRVAWARSERWRSEDGGASWVVAHCGCTPQAANADAIYAVPLETDREPPYDGELHRDLALYTSRALERQLGQQHRKKQAQCLPMGRVLSVTMGPGSMPTAGMTRDLRVGRGVARKNTGKHAV